MDLIETIKLVTKSHEDIISILHNENNENKYYSFICWIDTNNEGFYVRDLDYIIQIIELFITYLLNEENADIFNRFLEICSYPLIEVKGNERLSILGYSQITRYLLKLSSLWLFVNPTNKIKLGKCFRCIINGGRDPSILRSLQKQWIADGTRLRITDSSFIQKAFRESGSLLIITTQFLDAADLLHYGNTTAIGGGGGIGEQENDLNSIENSINNNHTNTEDSNNISSNKNLDTHDAEFYGVPKSFLDSKRIFPIVEVINENNSYNILKENSHNKEFEESKSQIIDNINNDVNIDYGLNETNDYLNVQSSITSSNNNLPIENSLESNTIDVNVIIEQRTNNKEVSIVENLDTNNDLIKEHEDENYIELNVGIQERKEQHSKYTANNNNENTNYLSLSTTLPIVVILTESEILQQTSSSKSPVPRNDITDTTSYNPVVLRELTNVLQQLCSDLSVESLSAAYMCESGLCDGTIDMIEKDFKLNPRDPRIPITIELIWNILEPFLEQIKTNSSSPDEVRQILSQYSDKVIDFNKAINTLQAVLIFVLSDGFRLADKELRNEVIIILTMLAHFPCAIGYFIETGLFNLLITYACIEEAGGVDSWDGFSNNIGKYRNFATVSDVDLEFKKSLWFLIAELLRSNDPEALSIASSSPLQYVMLLYLEQDSLLLDNNTKRVDGSTMNDGNLSASLGSVMLNTSIFDPLASSKSINEDKSLLPIKSSTKLIEVSASKRSLNGIIVKKKTYISMIPLSKLREFQLLSITFLLHNAPKTLSMFESLNGPIRILSIIVKYCQSEIFEHKTIIFNCLMLLQKCLLISPSVRYFMEMNTIMQTFLYVYQKSDLDQTKAQALRLIATLCENNNIQMQHLFDQLGGLSELVGLLTIYVKKKPAIVGLKAGIAMSTHGETELPDPFENPYGGETSYVVIAVLHCLHQVLVGNKSLESKFADLEGIDILLDLTETSHFILRLQVFRFISDILTNKALTVYAKAWRSSKTLRSAAQILCHAWLDEEARVIGQKRLNGIIEDLEHPLGHKISDHNQQSNLEDNMNDSPKLASGLNSPTPNSSIESSIPGAYFSELANNTTNSITVTKLASAILAGRNAKQTNLPIDICTQALERDSRVVISNILLLLNIYEIYGITASNTGGAISNNNENEIKSKTIQDNNNHTVIDNSYDVFDNSLYGDTSPIASITKNKVSFDENHINNNSSNFEQFSKIGMIDAKLSTDSTLITTLGNKKGLVNLGLTKQDQQVLVMANQYHILREGEWWQAVRDNALQNEIKPIESDYELIQKQLQISLNISKELQEIQINLYNEDEDMKNKEENEFLDQILIKKNQQIKAEWLKKNRASLMGRK